MEQVLCCRVLDRHGKLPAGVRFVSVYRRAVAAWLSYALFSTSLANASPVCPALNTFDYMGSRVSFTPDRSAYFLTSEHKLVDADGAPNAYHPDDEPDACPDNGRGIDCLEAAGYPSGTWWQTVLVADPVNPGRPALQKAGPHKGYFVSMTSLRDTSFAGAASPASYVDAARIPYVVLPAPIYRTDGMGEMGDIGWATNLANGQSTPFVIADEGPVEPFGEASVAFWEALGTGAPNPRNGQGLPDGQITYVVFPGSGRSVSLGWPIDRASLAREAHARLAAAGGPELLQSCVDTSQDLGASRISSQ
jgi:hypothetical protein